MPTPRYESVSAYLAAQSAPIRARLAKIRASVRGAVAGLEETISYGIPTYKLGGKAVVFFSAWKEHWALYPASSGALREVPELAGFKHGRGTLRIPYDAPVSARAVARFTKARAAEVAAPATVKRTGTETARGRTAASQRLAGESRAGSTRARARRR